MAGPAGDVLASGSERTPLRVPARARAVLLAALAVAGAGLLAVPEVRAASAPPRITAVPSGGTAVGARLRVWLLLQGPPGARLERVVPRLPGSDARAAVVPEAFSPDGDAVVRVDVTPRCPQAAEGLDDAALDVRLAGERQVRVPFAADGLLAAGVRTRCAGLAVPVAPRGPLVEAGTGRAGVLRAVVALGAPGPEVLVVERVTPGPGVAVEVVTPLPLRIAPGRRGRLVVDLRPGACAADTEAPPFVLEYAAQGEVEPVVDAGLRGRLTALRQAAC